MPLWFIDENLVGPQDAEQKVSETESSLLPGDGGEAVCAWEQLVYAPARPHSHPAMLTKRPREGKALRVWIQNVLHRLVCLNTWSPDNGAVGGGCRDLGRRGLAGGSGSLLCEHQGLDSSAYF